MPWYEPAPRAPRARHLYHYRYDDGDGGSEPHDGGHRDHRGDYSRRDDEEEAADVYNYLDRDWDYSCNWASSHRGLSSDGRNGQLNEEQLIGRDWINFDGFQHRVEDQLASVFPLADFSSSLSSQNNFLSRHSSSILHDVNGTSGSSLQLGSGSFPKDGSNALEDDVGDRYAQNQNANPNLKHAEGTNNNATTVSKAAQFFHPRPVAALMPYRDFFSPLQFPSWEGGAEARWHKPSLDDDRAGAVGNDRGLLLQNGFHGQAHHRDDAKHAQLGNEGSEGNSVNVNLSQQRGRFHVHGPGAQHHQLGYHNQDPSRDNVQHQQTQTPAEKCASDLAQILGPSQGIVTNRPTSDLKPKSLFNDIAADQRENPFKTFKRPPRQATLAQDSKTGRMMAQPNSARRASRPNEARKAKPWEEYGGRPLVDEGADEEGGNEDGGEGKEKAKEKTKATKDDSKGKRKDKKRKRKDKKQRQAEGGIVSFLDSFRAKKRPSDDSREDEAVAGKHKSDASSKSKNNEAARRRKSDGATRSKKAVPGEQKGKKPPSKNSQESEAVAGKRKSGAAANSKQDKALARNRKSDAAPKRKKQKRDRSLPSSGAELEVPIYDMADLDKPDANTSPALSEKDFEGIERTALQNAAQCTEGLQNFLSMLGSQSHVSFTMLFLDPYTGNYTTLASGGSDEFGGGGKTKKRPRSKKYTINTQNEGFECTTPFLPTSKKYCTLKGARCTAWNCTCDDQVRATRGSAMLLGAMFVFRNGGDGGDDADWQRFLLPLGPTEDQEVEYPRMSSWPVVPFQCGVTLKNRWRAFEAVLLNGRTKLVTYNATVSLLPYYQHLAKDVANRTGSGSPSADGFAACLTGGLDMHDHDNLPVSREDGCLRSIWDLRLASWMLRPHATDDDLEFSNFREGFAHLAPDHQRAPCSDMSILMQGLVQAKNDLEFIHSLYPIMNEQLVDGRLLDALESIEAPVQSILASMECRGIGFKANRLKSKEIEDRIAELEVQSRSITNDPEFLLSSPQQVSAFLFDELKLTIPAGLVSKTKAGSSHRSTSEEALKAIQAEMTARAGSSPQIIDIILEFRLLNKLLTSFLRPLPKFCRGKRSKKVPARIHPQWMQTAVRTGRLSCRKPNLQQVSNNGALGINPRDAFTIEQGMCLFACDYSQKEVRILAHMSGDDALLSLFCGDPNVDIYKQMSSLIRNKPVDAITSVERAQFKQVTLALLYGMSANQVAKKLSITKANAQQMMNDFFRRFRRVKAWMDETKAYARERLYVKTIAGRKRYLDDINSDDNGKKSQAERQAINTVIQGSAADLMKTAMINMARNLMQWRDDADLNGKSTCPNMLLQIHDEVILEVGFNMRDINQLQVIAQKSCCKDCEDFFGLKVPLLLKCSAGLSWGTMKEC